MNYLKYYDSLNHRQQGRWYEKYLDEAYEKFKSKILIGKYLASNIDKPPQKIQQILDYILSDNKKILFLKYVS